MTNETEVLVRDVYSSFARGDMRAVRALLHEDIVCSEPAEFPFGGTFSGRAEVEGYLSRSRGLWSDLRCEILTVTCERDRALVVVRHHGTVQSSGAIAEATVADILAFVDGALVRLQGFADLLAAQAEFDRNDSHVEAPTLERARPLLGERCVGDPEAGAKPT